ncbi:MAG: hopanoid biosynthesis-associated protein HpnK [Candidatus Eremiobacteraeota bacterium]|nr:hopanoid biosynthesis-associated protein HpnK [Candidatus Eremiobacteraeota bacterium]
MKQLIVTGDDFGASTLVNEAIEQAHRGGILNTTCLMVAGGAASDALRRAKRLPSLRVGLHVVVVDGRPLLEPHAIPALVDKNGEFSKQLVRAGFNFFFNPAAQRQLEAEIRAQFEAFRATGLELDHVNSHNHMHLHPTILGAIIRIGRDYGVKAMRVPREPFGPSWRATRSGLGLRFGNSIVLAPMLGLMQARLRRAGIASNDFVFGLSDTGHMTAERVRALLRALPDGVTEMYFHPASRTWPGMPAWAQAEEELAALTDVGIARYIADAGIAVTTYGALANAAA